MGHGPTEDPAPDMEMTSKEAAAYLRGPVGYSLSTKFPDLAK